jgi:hypothetical protein
MEFKDYAKEKPPHPGWYIWRVNHNKIKNVKITFSAQFRARGFGSNSILSPEFDHWDGYRTLLPKAIEWAYYREIKEDVHFKKATMRIHKRNRVLNVNDLYVRRCPFCQKIPELKYSGSFIGATPIDSEWWQFNCCQWATSPRMSNPVELIKKRNELLIGRW